MDTPKPNSQSAQFKTYQLMPKYQSESEQILWMKYQDSITAMTTSATVSNSSEIQNSHKDEHTLNKVLADMSKSMTMKDQILKDIMQRVDSLMVAESRWSESEPLRGIDDWNRVPNLQEELAHFEGIESQSVSLKWINKIVAMKRERQWSAEYTIEVATFYMIGNALVWAEMLDTNNWDTFYDEFLNTYVFNDQTEHISVSMIGRFLGYRDTNMVEMAYRRIVTDLEGKYITHNFFKKFMAQDEAEEKASKEAKLLKKREQIPNERTSLYLLIRSPTNTMRQINQKKLIDIVKLLQTKEQPELDSYFYVPDPEKVSRGPFSNCEKPSTPLFIDEICESNKRNCWSEWWMHLFLEDKITSKKPGPLNAKCIVVNEQSMMGIVDLGAEYCTIQYSAAVAKGLDMVSRSKTIGLYKDDGRYPIKSLGYVDAKVCMTPLTLYGRANLWVVPDDSQPTEVIIGESIIQNPLIFRDAPVEEQEQASWLDFEDVVFEETVQLREKDIFN